MNKKRGKNKRGQVWIETVIYTLMAFVLMGLVLNFAIPEINKMQDNVLLKQSTEMLKQIDLTILSMSGAGNQRILEITIKKGDLNLDCVNNKIIFELESKSEYSEPGKNISDGNIIVLTQKRTGSYLVTLTRDFSSQYNLRFNGEDVLKPIHPASNPYKLSILNEGEDINSKIVMNLSLN